MKIRKKRCFALLLALVLSISLLGTGAYAAGDGHTYKFSLLADEQVDTLAATGDIVPVKLILTNTTASGNYDLYTMQDYVTFDTSFFELVDSSIELLNGAGLSANGMSFSLDTPDRIYINRTSTTPASVEKEAVLMTFELKVIGTSGTGTIEHNTYFVSKDLSSSVSSAASATVTIGTRQIDDEAPEAGGDVGGGTTPAQPEKPEQLSNSSYLSCQKDSSCPVAGFADTNPNEWYHNGVH